MFEFRDDLFGLASLVVVRHHSTAQSLPPAIRNWRAGRSKRMVEQLGSHGDTNRGTITGVTIRPRGSVHEGANLPRRPVLRIVMHRP